MSTRAGIAGPTERVVIIGAGLGGLSAALRLAGAGRSVRVIEASEHPGGLMAVRTVDGYRFETGPTVLTMPSLIDDALASVGEARADWLDLQPVNPSYRGQFADGSSLRSYADEEEMAAEVARVCGPVEAAGYRRLRAYLVRLFETEFEPFMATNLDGPADLVNARALALLRLGGLRGLAAKVDGFITDDRLRRLFTFQALYAGVAPNRARALYGVISYLDSIGGVWHPRGGMHQVAAALAGAGAKHGVRFSYQTRATGVQIANGRVRAVLTDAGERVPADVVIVNSDLRRAYAELLPVDVRPPGQRFRSLLPGQARYSPSAFVWHVGSAAPLPTPAHHTISFGAAWQQTFTEIIDQGKLMTDPSLLISDPSFDDPSAAPAGRHSYFVLAPCPNTETARIDWPRVAPRYQEEIARVLAERGFDSAGAFSSGVETDFTMDPAEWRHRGLTAGTPFALAHTLGQTGPLRHPTQHPSIPTLLFCGAGVQPGVGVPTVLLSGQLAAARVTG
ncbi:MAG: zeta-phytoene desaturase [Frankiales bacterium]|nr:zeta-phytoene desaturase [Frankiales bacterium]